MHIYLIIRLCLIIERLSFNHTRYFISYAIYVLKKYCNAEMLVDLKKKFANVSMSFCYRSNHKLHLSTKWDNFIWFLNS